MARGQRTDFVIACVVKEMSEMGFQPGAIAELMGLPRGTVREISCGQKWAELAHDETFRRLRVRVRSVIEASASELAEKTIHRLEEKIPTASITELAAIFDALAGAAMRAGTWKNS